VPNAGAATPIPQSQTTDGGVLVFGSQTFHAYVKNVLLAFADSTPPHIPACGI
jgi:hypothetical protein